MGFGIKKDVTSNVSPSTIVYFDKATPTEVGVVFTPNTPATVDVLYISSVDASTWIWNGSVYISYVVPSATEWYLYGTTIDAGSNKTDDIQRSGAIYVSVDSYFNDVRVGQGSGSNSTNTIVGDKCLQSNTTGTRITAVGTGSLQSNTASNNTAFGWGSLNFNSSGTNNTGVGSEALLRNVTGSNNSAIGYQAGEFLANGSTANTTPENSVFLGYSTRSLTNNDTNQIVIGYLALGKGSNTVQLGNTSITNTYLQGAVTVNNAFTLPTTDGTANYFLKTNGSGTVTWGVAGLSFFTEAQATASPNNLVYANSLTAVATTTNADFVIRPKGTGAILARIPDGTGTGGNKRGQYALDLSRYAGASGAYIAGGDYDIILGGSRNSSNTGTYSFIANGDYNYCTGTYGTILNGNNNSVTGARGIVVNGQYNQANGAGSVAIGGLYNYANGGSSVALGGGNTASGTSSFATGSATTASGQLSFSANNGSLADGYSSNAFGDYGWANGIRAKFAIGASGWGYGTTQAAITQLDGRTTNTTPTVLLANTQNAGGITASTQFTLPNNSLMRVKGSIQGKQSGSTNCGVWDFDAVLVRGTTASTMTVVSSNINVVTNTPVFGTPTITANTTLGCMTVTVTGIATTNIQWACRIDSTETLYA